VHGGGFLRGDKRASVTPLFDPLTKAGFTWFSVNYRLAPKYPFPAAVEDVERVIQFVKSHARQYKVDVNRIALIGESSGGSIVSYIGAQNKPADQVAAVVAFYAVHDWISRAVGMLRLDESMHAYFGVNALNADTAPLLRNASPFIYAKKDMPPFLLIHGTDDRVIPYEQSVQMCEKIQKVGGACELFPVRGGGHGMGSWEKEEYSTIYRRHMIKWLKAALQ
jgi:alpha-L-fucosidase 2